MDQFLENDGPGLVWVYGWVLLLLLAWIDSLRPRGHRNDDQTVKTPRQ